MRSFLLFFLGLWCAYAQRSKVTWATRNKWVATIRNRTRAAVFGGRGRVLFEFDMLLPLKQVKEAIKNGKMTVTDQQHQEWRWPSGVIPYKIERRLKCRNRVYCFLGGGGERAIKSAMREWEKKTCIKFVERTNEKDYVEFNKNIYGLCAASHVGRQHIGRQRVLLGPFCMNRGNLLHQLGHVIGFVHENSRLDRDNEVNVNLAQVKKGNQYNYLKYKMNQLRRSLYNYDQQSIMQLGGRHLGRNTFHGTLSARRGNFGRWRKLSNSDIAKTNELYKEECRKQRVVG